MTTKRQKSWLIEYAVTEVGLLADEKTLTSYGLVEAPDIKAAEFEALLKHVPEGFSECPPYVPRGGEVGEWTTIHGLRAFELNDQGSDVDAGDILWIKFIQEVEPADAPVLKKHLHRDLTREQAQAEEEQQIRLRGADVVGGLSAANGPLRFPTAGDEKISTPSGARRVRGGSVSKKQETKGIK